MSNSKNIYSIYIVYTYIQKITYFNVGKIFSETQFYKVKNPELYGSNLLKKGKFEIKEAIADDKI